jgi:hypothetical protein
MAGFEVITEDEFDTLAVKRAEEILQSDAAVQGTENTVILELARAVLHYAHCTDSAVGSSVDVRRPVIEGQCDSGLAGPDRTITLEHVPLRGLSEGP